MFMQRSFKNVTSKWLGLLILIILFAFLNYNSQTLIFKTGEDIPVSVSREFLKGEFPDLDTITISDDLPTWNVVLRKSGEISGYYRISETNRWSYSGYSGPVPIFIKMAPDLTISEIQLLENRETRRFLSRLYNQNYLKSWNGKTLEEAADSNVDAVTGVTITSNVITANLSEVLEGNVGRSPMGRIDYRRLIVRILEILLLIFALFSFFIGKMRKYRIPFLVVLIAVFGFIAGDFISMAMIRGFFTGAVPFIANPVLWILFGTSIVIPLFTNKAFYCTYLCPFGAAQELVGKFTDRKKKLPSSLKKAAALSRPVIFGIIALLIILDYKIDLSLVEPFAAFLYSVAAPLTIALAVGSLVLSLIYNKPWCRWLCPTGQFLEYFRSDK